MTGRPKPWGGSSDDNDDDDVRLGYLLLSSLQGICGKIAWGATYEAICAENVINE